MAQSLVAGSLLFSALLHYAVVCAAWLWSGSPGVPDADCSQNSASDCCRAAAGTLGGFHPENRTASMSRAVSDCYGFILGVHTFYLSSFTVLNCVFAPLPQKLSSTQFCWFNSLSDCFLKHIVKLHLLFAGTAVFKTFCCCPVFYGLFSCAMIWVINWKEKTSWNGVLLQFCLAVLPCK